MREYAMTETQWLACSDPEELWDVIYPHACDDSEYPSIRKVRLFVCACWRRVWKVLRYEASRKAVEVAERYAEVSEVFGRQRKSLCCRKSLRVKAEAQAAFEALLADIPLDDELQRLPATLEPGLRTDMRRSLLSGDEMARAGARAAESVVDVLTDWSWCPHRWEVKSLYEAPAREATDERAELAAQCDLLRCVFGNEFWTLWGEFAWRTPGTLALTRAIYAERDFTALPVLADMLEEAGCDKAAILDHCRNPGPHVRGCWVVDLILGKR